MNNFLTEIGNSLPPQLLPVLLVLGFSFLIGLQREERASVSGSYAFGGVRTFPALGFSGYVLARLTGGAALPLAAGIAVAGAILWLSYRNKLLQKPAAGATTEITGLFTFLLGGLVEAESRTGQDYWEATALTVMLLMLLALKDALERLARRIPAEEIYTLARFLLLAAVILPAVPNQNYTAYDLNPFRIWTVAVVISGLSYGAYLANKLFGARYGTLFAAMVGGLYASTATTVVLARQSRLSGDNRLLSGAMLIAAGMVYVRIPLMLFLFSPAMADALLPVCVLLSLGAAGGGWMMARMDGSGRMDGPPSRNPLGLGEALLFAALFTVMSIAGQSLAAYAGTGGLFGLAALSGSIDIDPFILSLTGMAGKTLPVSTAAAAVLAAAAVNQVLKAFYAVTLASAGTGRLAFLTLLPLGAMTAGAIFWISA